MKLDDACAGRQAHPDTVAFGEGDRDVLDMHRSALQFLHHEANQLR